MALRIEESTSPLVEKFGKQTDRFYCNGTIKVEGCVVPERYRHFAERLKDFEVRHDDVWIVTYPKCGTTWTQEMVWLLLNNLNFEGAKEPLSTRSPFLEYWGFEIPEEMAKLDTPNTFELTEQTPSPRCIKCHMPKDLLPDQLWTKKPKIIYVTRSAKDIIVSFYYHHQLLYNYKGTIDDFLDAALSDEVLFWSPIWKHILEFWEMRHEPNILINTYEEMKRDLPGVIRKTAAFLGLEALSEAQVGRLAEHLSFASMRANPAVNFAPVVQALNARWGAEHRAFMRRGEAGAGARELSAAQAARVDAWSRRRLARHPDFPFVG